MTGPARDGADGPAFSPLRRAYSCRVLASPSVRATSVPIAAVLGVAAWATGPIGGRVGLLAGSVSVLVALFTAVGVAGTIRSLVGGEASRGGLEELLATPYTPGSIATALLVLAVVMATALWAMMSALGAVIVALSVLATGDSATVTGPYLAVALILPLPATWAGAGLSRMVNLLFPRLAQLGKARSWSTAAAWVTGLRCCRRSASSSPCPPAPGSDRASSCSWAA